QGASFFAYDAAPKRMGDLPDRAKRAGVSIEVLTQDPVGGDADFDCVILDVPCSGTGAWRRNPEGKWRLTATDLADVIATQQQILTRASQLVSDEGHLIYMTCSVLRDENQDQIAPFLEQNSGWVMHSERNIEPLSNMDGFFVAVLSRG
ncbi:MAG: SAM-dependent methyltransferase, partial [Rhodobacteraceae bacterium]